MFESCFLKLVYRSPLRTVGLIEFFLSAILAHIGNEILPLVVMFHTKSMHMAIAYSLWELCEAGNVLRLVIWSYLAMKVKDCMLTKAFYLLTNDFFMEHASIFPTLGDLYLLTVFTKSTF